MNQVTSETAAAFAGYAEVTGVFFYIAYKTGINLGMPMELATVFAKQLLELMITSKQKESELGNLASLMEQMTSGGAA